MFEDELINCLSAVGADIIGFADLKSIDEKHRKNMPYGISIGVKIKPEIVDGIENGPTKEYYDEYKRLNKLFGQRC